MEFGFEEFSQSVGVKTTAFEFPGTNGTFVQDNGRTGRRVPIQAIFSGANCDLQANAFGEMLGEIGIGTLEHPRYGRLQVVPTGDIGRADPLVSGANEIKISVEFYETIGVVWPEEITNFQGLSIGALLDFPLDSATDFAGKLNTSRPGLLPSADLDFQSKFLNAVSALSNLGTSLPSAIDSLALGPLTAAFQVSQAILSIAAGPSLLLDKLNAYGNLLEGIFLQKGTTPTGLEWQVASVENARAIADFHASSYVVGSIQSASVSTWKSRSEIFSTLDTLYDFQESWTAWREAAGVVTGNTAQSVYECLGYVAGALLEASFSTSQERVYVTPSDMSPLDLCAYLYGDLSKLDQLISTNNLGGDELETVPAGTEVLYYG
jgi:hypothetical protein